MPLVIAKCTQCGAALEVDQTMEAAVCPYCKMPYIVEKAINIYNIQNSLKENSDFVIKAGTLIRYRGEATEVVIPDSVIEIG